SQAPTASSTLSLHDALPIFINGVALIALAVLIGWVWFFGLLGRIVLWPLPIDIEVNIPTDARGWRMAHMEGITQGLMLMALGLRSEEHTSELQSRENLVCRL